jgi:UDP-N-acetylglucosamine transferase subunit ALG13
VITHAGAGSTLVCLQLGKHPVLVPRQPRYGEIVDEHQLPFAEKFGQLGLATTVHEMAELRPAIDAVRGKSAPTNAAGRAHELTSWLEDFWQEIARETVS